MANGLRGLARLHRAYWGFSGATHPELAWVQTWEPTEGFQSGLRRRVPTGLERAGDTIPAAVAKYDGDEIVDLWVRFVSSLTIGPVTLLHGDAHIGNTYLLPDDDVGFLDWEVVRRGNWSHDAGYFLIGSLTEDDRRAREADLVDAYLAALDVPPDQRPAVQRRGCAIGRRRPTASQSGCRRSGPTVGSDGRSRSRWRSATPPRSSTSTRSPRSTSSSMDKSATH